VASRAGLGSMYLNWFPTIKFTVLTTLCFWNKTPRHLEICFSRFNSEDFETSENVHQAAQCHIPEELFPNNTACLTSDIAHVHTLLISRLQFPTAYKDTEFNLDLILAIF